MLFHGIALSGLANAIRSSKTAFGSKESGMNSLAWGKSRNAVACRMLLSRALRRSQSVAAFFFPHAGQSKLTAKRPMLEVKKVRLLGGFVKRRMASPTGLRDSIHMQYGYPGIPESLTSLVTSRSYTLGHCPPAPQLDFSHEPLVQLSPSLAAFQQLMQHTAKATGWATSDSLF